MNRFLSQTTLLLVLLGPGYANAYIDPGTGSALVQGLIAGIAAVGVTVKLYWHKLASLFAKTSESQVDDAEPAGEKGDGAGQ